MDLVTGITVAGSALGIIATVGGIGWTIARNTGETNVQLRHLTGFCEETKDWMEKQAETNHDHNTRLRTVEKDVEHHGKRLDRVDTDIHELRNHHRVKP